MRTRLLLLSALTLSSLASCKQDPVAEGGSCSKVSDCLEGLDCVEGICIRQSTAVAAGTPTGYCGTLAAMAGSWSFDTTVIGAENLAPRGINGHFQMTVSVDQCNAKIELSKSGYDDVVFSKGKVQHSDAALSESKKIPSAAEATFSLKDKPTHTMTFMIRDGQLFGYYHYADSEWRRAGFWGTLRGVKVGQDLADVEDFGAQPCEVRCLTQCDAERGRSDQTLDEPMLAACMTACGSGAEIVGCGAGAAMPEDLHVAVHGPAKSLEELCTKVGSELQANAGVGGEGPPVTCDQEPEIQGKPTKRELTKARLKGSFVSAKIIEVGYFDTGYVGELVLVMQTETGWYWTDALADMSVSGMGGIGIETQGIKLQSRDMLSPAGRELMAEVRTRFTDSDLGVNEVSIDDNKRLVVCATGAPPICIGLNIDWSSNRTLIEPKGVDRKKHPDLRSESGEVYIAILPDDRVSISAASEARAADRELAGIYAWPK